MLRAHPGRMSGTLSSFDKAMAREAAKRKVDAMIRGTPVPSHALAVNARKSRSALGTLKAQLKGVPMLNEAFFDLYREMVDRIDEKTRAMQEDRLRFKELEKQLSRDVSDEMKHVQRILLVLLNELQIKFRDNATVEILMEDMRKYVARYVISEVLMEKALIGDTSEPEEHARGQDALIPNFEGREPPEDYHAPGDEDGGEFRAYDRSYAEEPPEEEAYNTYPSADDRDVDGVSGSDIEN